jgi:hypothetical protein
MTTYNTLLLDQSAWDLVLDSSGNIALATPPYAIAQDVSCAIRLFLGELWYDTTQGIPYWGDVLGQLPPAGLLTQLIQNAALTVPGVVTAICTIQSFNDREVMGQVEFVDENSVTSVVTI